MTKIIVFGVGSSAQRFIRILQSRGVEVYVFIHREGLEIPDSCIKYSYLENLSQFQAAIIASPTHTHAQYLKACLNQKIPTLVDKPVVDNLKEAQELLKLARKNQILVRVGFNLRYLPIVSIIAEYLSKEKLGKVLYAHLHVGQYLPDWRPHQKYAEGYSASHARGGGVALDLIHELDLACAWFASPNLRTSFSNKISSLSIDTEDYLQVVTPTQPRIEVTLDYLSHIKTRRYMIVGDQGTLICDLYQPSFTYESVDHHQITLKDAHLFDVASTYQLEVDSFLKEVTQKSKIKPDSRSWGIDALKIALKARKHVP
jgi:predicted dehydrogenase